MRIVIQVNIKLGFGENKRQKELIRFKEVIIGKPLLRIKIDRLTPVVMCSWIGKFLSGHIYAILANFIRCSFWLTYNHAVKKETPRDNFTRNCWSFNKILLACSVLWVIMFPKASWTDDTFLSVCVKFHVNRNRMFRFWRKGNEWWGKLLMVVMVLIGI